MRATSVSINLTSLPPTLSKIQPTFKAFPSPCSLCTYATRKSFWTLQRKVNYLFVIVYLCYAPIHPTKSTIFMLFLLASVLLFSWGIVTTFNTYLIHKTYMKIIYLFAKLFIVLVKVSLPLIQEIVMLFLHDVNNTLHSFIEEKKNTKNGLSKNLTHQNI